jgi:hypothetical protein
LSKSTKIYIAILVLLLLGIVYVETTKKEPVNWYPTYAAKHKIPYGTYILKQELSTFFPKTKIQNVKISPYIYLQDSSRNGTYLFIDKAINFGKEEFVELMKFVERGNDVLISTKGINIDTLHFKTKRILSYNLEEKPFFKLVNRVFKNKEYSFDRQFSNVGFVEVDTLNTTVLGITGYLNKENERTEEAVNFVKFNYGKGQFFFHTFPEAFTNYSILKGENHQYAANILSYLNEDKTILWDAYYKTGKSKIGSPMYYLLSSKYLKWAYYFALIGVLIFVVFGGKRLQRVIPVIKPLKNQTVAFTRTIANMYYEKSEHKSIAEHKISYLLEFVRTKLNVSTSIINESFYNYVALRSGNEIDFVKKLFNYCDAIHSKNTISNDELIRLNKMIEKFKNTVQNGK